MPLRKPPGTETSALSPRPPVGRLTATARGRPLPERMAIFAARFHDLACKSGARLLPPLPGGGFLPPLRTNAFRLSLGGYDGVGSPRPFGDLFARSWRRIISGLADGQRTY